MAVRFATILPSASPEPFEPFRLQSPGQWLVLGDVHVPFHDRVTLERAIREVRRVVPGVGPDAPTAVNASGGKQSQSLYRCDLLPARASLAVAEVLHHGAAKYGPNNWRKIPTEDHINHAMVHLFAWLAGDTQDDHLEHAACRLLMGLDVHLGA
jgi:hypothetical protein